MIVRALTVGPIVGVTGTTTVRLWGRGDRHEIEGGYHRVFGVAQVEIRRGQVQTKFFKMLPKFDFTGIVNFGGLRTNTTYRYRVGYVLAELEPKELNRLRNANFQWEDDSWNEFRTNPSERSDISFLLGSCRYLSRLRVFDNRGDKTFRSAVKHLEEHAVNALIMVGDQIYADDFWKFDPDKEQEEYFRKYRNAFKQPNIRKLMSKVSTYMILDDHEIINDWNKDFMEEDENMRELLVSALSAYHPYQMVHGPAYKPSNNAEEDTTPTRFWYDFNCGKGVFFALDTRTERSPRDGEIIGEEQMTALKRWLNRNKNRPKFVITSVPFFPDRTHGDSDKWAGFSDQRLEILDYIARRNLQKVIFLSGDIHSSGVATVTCPQIQSLRIHQIISSPFWWPASPGSSKRFKNKSSLGSRRGNEFIVSDAVYFTDNDNFVNVTLNGNQLEVNAIGRKGKQLKSAVLAF